MTLPSTKRCPYCDEQIKADATECVFCGELVGDVVPAAVQPKTKAPDPYERLVLPVGRPISAIAAGYCALFGILPMCGLPFSIAALVCGIVALRTIKSKPDLTGSVRAWFGIILGSLEILFLLTMITLIILGPTRRPF